MRKETSQSAVAPVWKSTLPDESHPLDGVSSPVGKELQMQAGVCEAFKVNGAQLCGPPEPAITDGRVTTAGGRDNFVNSHDNLRPVNQAFQEVVNQPVPLLPHVRFQ